MENQNVGTGDVKSRIKGNVKTVRCTLITNENEGRKYVAAFAVHDFSTVLKYMSENPKAQAVALTFNGPWQDIHQILTDADVSCIG